LIRRSGGSYVDRKGASPQKAGERFLDLRGQKKAVRKRIDSLKAGGSALAAMRRGKYQSYKEIVLYQRYLNFLYRPE